MAFTGNVIPLGRRSANGMAILNAYPAPTPGYSSGTQNWIAQAAHPINQRKQVINVDWVINDQPQVGVSSVKTRPTTSISRSIKVQV